MRGSYTPANGERFQEAIERFVNDPTTVVVRGAYNRGAGGGGFPADFYHQPHSRLVVVVTVDAEFVTGFRMSVQQATAFRRTARLGGGA